MLPEHLEQASEKALTDIHGSPVKIERFSTVSGGSINQAGHLATNEGDFFIKWNVADRYPGMFRKEARGLELLRAPGVINVPEVHCWDESNNDAFIIMEYIAPGREEGDFWKDFARALARLHRNGNDYFGLDHHNYMGSLEQFNHPHQKWTDFFVEQRLKVQVKLARDTNEIDRSQVQLFEQLYPKLENICPEEQPALIHGDLWSGNFMVNRHNEPCLIDPAAYYGHREAELAMTRLFGGFDRSFYTYYDEAYPLEKGFDERYEVYNLYPLMIHVNLFGAGGYLGQTLGILERFV